MIQLSTRVCEGFRAEMIRINLIGATGQRIGAFSPARVLDQNDQAFVDRILDLSFWADRRMVIVPNMGRTSPAEYLDKTLRYVDRLATWSKGRIDVWQIGNEPSPSGATTPDFSYPSPTWDTSPFWDFLVEVVAAVRARFPQLHLVGPSWNFPAHSAETDQILKRGYLQQVDGYSFHDYLLKPAGAYIPVDQVPASGTAQTPLTSHVGRYAMIRAKVDKYRPGLPLWVNECGLNNAADPLDLQKLAAAQIATGVVSVMLNNIQFQNTANNPEWYWAGFDSANVMLPSLRVYREALGYGAAAPACPPAVECAPCPPPVVCPPPVTCPPPVICPAYRDVTDAELLAVNGIGPKTLRNLRARFPRLEVRA